MKLGFLRKINSKLSFRKINPSVFILDVDGVMTTGQFLYSELGKSMKIFGPDDNDGLCLLKKFLQIRFVSADSRGFSITKKRIVDDMGYKLDLVDSTTRLKWISDIYDLNNVIYMGDGIFDWITMQNCFYSISCRDSSDLAKKYSNYVTKSSSGNRSVSEASFHIIKKFFNNGKIENLITSYLNDIKKKT